jgi:hypothetical protein
MWHYYPRLTRLFSGIHTYFIIMQVVHLILAQNCNCEHCRSVRKMGGLSSIASEYVPLTENGEQGDREMELGPRAPGV